MARRGHPLLLFLLAALLAARALVPAGWMPAAGDDGVRITLCTGQGLVVATLDAEGKLKPADAEKHASKQSCPFGMLAQAADVPAMAELAAPPAPEAALPTPLADPVLVARLHAPRPPTRGPPALA